MPAAGRDPSAPVSGTRGLGAAAISLVAMTATLAVVAPFAFLAWLPQLLGERLAVRAHAAAGARRGVRRLLHGHERRGAAAAAARAGAPGPAPRETSEVRRPRVAIIGLGLVGGSLARALTRRGYAVTGIDWPLVVRRALATRAITRGRDARRGGRAVRPRGAGGASGHEPAPAAPPRAVAPPELVLTDVSSVKRDIVREAARLGLRGFVGGHPMAGTEKRGFAASSAGLFQGATWWLVPSRERPRQPQRARARARRGRAPGHAPTPPRHDRVMAFLSHAPQVVAWALFEAARRRRGRACATSATRAPASAT